MPGPAGEEPRGLSARGAGAPSLLNEEIKAGRIDAVITFWHYAARLEAVGMRRLMGVDEAARALGVHSRVPLIGYVFSEAWGERHRDQVPGDRQGEAGPVDRLLAVTGLEDARHLYASRLSMGMGRRVALARAFAIRLEILPMDETLVSLDAPTAHRPRLLLLEIWRSGSRAIGACRARLLARNEELFQGPGRGRGGPAARGERPRRGGRACRVRARWPFPTSRSGIDKASALVPDNAAPTSHSARPSSAVSAQIGQDFYFSH